MFGGFQSSLLSPPGFIVLGVGDFIVSDSSSLMMVGSIVSGFASSVSSIAASAQKVLYLLYPGAMWKVATLSVRPSGIVNVC